MNVLQRLRERLTPLYHQLRPHAHDALKRIATIVIYSMVEKKMDRILTDKTETVSKLETAQDFYENY